MTHISNYYKLTFKRTMSYQHKKKALPPAHIRDISCLSKEHLLLFRVGIYNEQGPFMS